MRYGPVGQYEYKYMFIILYCIGAHNIKLFEGTLINFVVHYIRIRKYSSTFYVGTGQVQNGLSVLKVYKQLWDNHSKVRQ